MSSSSYQVLTRTNRPNPIVIKSDVFSRMTAIGPSGKMAYKELETIEVNGEIIETRDITGFSPIQNHEQENKWTPPVENTVNEANLEWLRELKQALFVRKEKYDPYKHLPPHIVTRLESKGFDLESNLSLGEQEAINDGRARLDKDGYVIYNYDKEIRHYEAKKQLQKRAYAQQKNWEGIMS